MNVHSWIAHLVLALFALTGASPNAVSAIKPVEITGTWNGSLHLPTGALALELTVKRNADETLSATLESLDQAPGQLIPITRVQIEGSRLRLEINALSATYDGQWKTTESSWVGNWSQGEELPLTFNKGPAAKLPTVAGLDGIWRGSLTRNGAQLRLILHVVSARRGSAALLDSPDVGATGLQVSELARMGDRVSFRVPMAQVRFVGNLDEGATRFVGTWQREGQPEATVTFVRDELNAGDSAQPRPQTPKAPFDYEREEVRFKNPEADGVTLSGTLTLPNGTGPFSAAILISGSGPQDRDQSLFGHKPFAVLADHLTRHGIAVLRYDDRGTAESTGKFAGATSLDFASDARAAVTYLTGRDDINPRAIGLIGHSEGGVVAPLAVIDNETIAYLVLLAAPGTHMSEILISQRRLMGVMQGISERKLIDSEPLLAKIYAQIASAPSRAEARRRVEKLLTAEALAMLELEKSGRNSVIDQLTRDWLRELLRYDSAATLRKIDIPLLAMNGSLDRQVPASENLAVIERAVHHNPDATVRLLPGLNHLFQTATTGAMGEYSDIAESFAPVALDVISGWINARFGSR